MACFMKTKNLILSAGCLVFAMGMQSAIAFPQGTYLLSSDGTDEPAAKTYTSKKDSVHPKCWKNKQRNKCVGKDGNSNAQRISKRIEELSGMMRSISDEIKALEISKKTVGGDVIPFAGDCRAKNNYSHFYVGLGIDYSWMAVKDKVKADERILKWNEQKVDYYALVSSVLSYVERDNDGNIIYAEDGYPKYHTRQDPMYDDDIKEFYTITTQTDGTQTGTLKAGVDKAKLQALLKEKVDLLIGYSSEANYQNSLMMVTTGKSTDPNQAAKYFRYSNVYLGNNEYGNTQQGHFYFGTKATDNDDLTYKDGLDNWENLKWQNLIFTDKYDQTKADDPGRAVSFMQVLGTVIEQTFEGKSVTTAAGQTGMYTSLYSERYKENDSDAFEKTTQLAAIDEHMKSYKPVFGGTVFVGYGARSGKLFYGAELGVGYSCAKTKVVKSDTNFITQTDFANGCVQYVDKNATVTNPATGVEAGKVYDASSGKVRPVYLSGMGRQTSADALELPDFTRGYDLEVKKTVSFSVTPMIGYAHMNTVYYASLGVSYNRYQVKIDPSSALSQYSNAIPVAYMKGYMENLKGSTFLHKYLKRLASDGSGEFITVDEISGDANARSNYKMEPIYPSSVVESNSDGEQNVFSGLRINYPHYDDGGISVVGESDSSTNAERPWLDSNLAADACSTKKVKKFRFGFEPGVGFRTYLNSRYFVDLRYSFQFGESIKVKHQEFAAYPVHYGRSGMNHKLEITGHKIRLSFGCNL